MGLGLWAREETHAPMGNAGCEGDEKRVWGDERGVGERGERGECGKEEGGVGRGRLEA